MTKLKIHPRRPYGTITSTKIHPRRPYGTITTSSPRTMTSTSPRTMTTTSSPMSLVNGVYNPPKSMSKRTALRWSKIAPMKDRRVEKMDIKSLIQEKSFVFNRFILYLTQSWLYRKLKRPTMARHLNKLSRLILDWTHLLQGLKLLRVKFG